jgi:hypothetical protein
MQEIENRNILSKRPPTMDRRSSTAVVDGHGEQHPKKVLLDGDARDPEDVTAFRSERATTQQCRYEE